MRIHLKRNRLKIVGEASSLHRLKEQQPLNRGTKTTTKRLSTRTVESIGESFLQEITV